MGQRQALPKLPSPALTDGAREPQASARGFLALSLTASIVCLAAPPTDSRLLDAVKNQDGATVRTLLKQKIAVNTPDTDGTTPLIYAAHVDDLETVKLLLAAGADAKA